MRERIVAAAVMHEGVIHFMPAPARHCDVLHALYTSGITDTNLNNQGFVTSLGRFVDRFEGVSIAEQANQLNVVRKKTGSPRMLFSEDVW